MFVSFLLIAAVTVVINAGVFVFLDGILRLLSVPQEVYGLMREYLWVIFWGIGEPFFIIIMPPCCGRLEIRWSR